MTGGNIEHIQLNNTDPWKEVDGERSSVKTKHPFLTDPAVRQALSLLVDRASVQEQIYGRTGIATANFLNAPHRFNSKNTKLEFNVDKANQILEAAGWKKGSRRHPGQGRQEAQDGLPDLHQCPAAEEPGHRQAGGGQGGHRDRDQVGDRVGVLLLRRRPTRTPTPTSPPTSRCTRTTHDRCRIPQLFMLQFTSWEVATKENKWQGRNITRWRTRSTASSSAAEDEMDPVKRAALFIQMNDLVIKNVVVIPVGLAAPGGRDQQQAPGRPRAAGTPISGTSRSGTRRRESRRAREVDGGPLSPSRSYRVDVKVPAAARADHAPRARGDQPGAVHHPRHGPGRSVRGAGHQSQRPARRCARTCAPSSASTIRSRCATPAGSCPCSRATGASPS